MLVSKNEASEARGGTALGQDMLVSTSTAVALRRREGRQEREEGILGGAVTV